MEILETLIIEMGVSFYLIIIAAFVALFVLVVKSAKQKGRSPWAWFFLSLFFTPILCLFILLCIGMTDEEKRKGSYRRGKVEIKSERRIARYSNRRK